MISIQSRKHYEKIENIREFEEGISIYFEEKLNQTIDKTQDLNADIFYFGKKIAGHFKTIQEFNDYNWLGKYSEAKINARVEAHIRRSGYLFGATPIRSTEEKKGEEEPK